MVNIVEVFEKQASLRPEKTAITIAKKDRYASLTFGELMQRYELYAANFSALGIQKGHKILLFIRPSLDFSAVTFALFKIGAVPIFIDPGMGRKNLLAAIELVQPDGLISEPSVHFLRLIYRQAFKTVRFFMTTGFIRWGEMQRLRDLQKENLKPPEVAIKESDLAAILFTSGGTGRPKGVEYTHKIFVAQTKALQEIFSLTAEDIDIPGFPLFSLFTLAMGMTSCIPDMHPGKPAQANPQKLFKNIMQQRATFVAGSPAIWERLADYCQNHGFVLPTVKFLVMFGAPVSLQLLEKFDKILPNGSVYTPYGATECLPVANAAGEFLLEYSKHKNLAGQGTCVGKPIPQIQLKIIEIVEGPLQNYTELAVGQVGEIIVAGDLVTRRYHQMEDKTWEAKIVEKGVVWHRMGDLGYIDKAGYLWFCGRKTHRVEELFSVPCEAIFNQHPAVKRSALVGPQISGKIEPSLVVERKDGLQLSGRKRHKFQEELLSLGQGHPHTQTIQRFYLRKSFPVDVRHNIKIDRLKLKNEIEQGLLQ